VLLVTDDELVRRAARNLPWVNVLPGRGLNVYDILRSRPRDRRRGALPERRRRGRGMNPHDVLLRPVLSEKAVGEIQDGKYAFFVHPSANRTQVKDAVERVFNVEVVKINIAKVRPRTSGSAATSASTPSARRRSSPSPRANASNSSKG
jgi:large subunit ribosomal protein L23